MQHIFITGPSGAGKTTLAKILATRLRLPLVTCDSHSLWQSTLRPAEELLAKGQPAGFAEVRRLAAAETIRTAAEKSVIEGGQLVGVPELCSKGKIIVVLPTRATVMAQRTARRTASLWRKGKEANVEILHRIASYLYDEFLVDLQPFLAGINQVPVLVTNPVIWCAMLSS